MLSSLSAGAWEVIFEGLSHLENLEELRSVYRPIITPRVVSHLRRSKKLRKTLRILQLSYATFVDGATIFDLLLMKSNNNENDDDKNNSSPLLFENLEQFHFKDHRFPNNNNNGDSEDQNNNNPIILPKLKQLTLSGCENIGEDLLRCLVTPQKETLLALEISSCSFEENIKKDWFKYIAPLKHLQTLVMQRLRDSFENQAQFLVINKKEKNGSSSTTSTLGSELQILSMQGTEGVDDEALDILFSKCPLLYHFTMRPPMQPKATVKKLSELILEKNRLKNIEFLSLTIKGTDEAKEQVRKHIQSRRLDTNVSVYLD